MKAKLEISLMDVEMAIIEYVTKNSGFTAKNVKFKTRIVDTTGDQRDPCPMGVVDGAVVEIEAKVKP